MTNRDWLRSLDEGQFAALRALTIFVQAGGGSRQAERRWFQELIDDENLSDSRKRILSADLLSPPSLPQVYSQIRFRYDTGQLRKWAQTLIEIDGHVSREENLLLAELIRLEEEADRREKLTSPDALADSLVEMVDRNVMWSDLRAAGQAARLASSPWPRSKLIFSLLPRLGGNALLYVFVFFIAMILGSAGFSRHKMLQVQPVVAHRLQELCQTGVQCGDAQKYSNDCVEASWLNGASVGRYGGASNRPGGLQTDLYLGCLNAKIAPAAHIAREHARVFEVGP